MIMWILIVFACLAILCFVLVPVIIFALAHILNNINDKVGAGYDDSDASSGGFCD